MRILVTGGLGVIGSSISRRLLEADHKVVIWDAMEAPRNRWVAKLFGADFRRRRVDIVGGRIEQSTTEWIKTNVRDVDAVIHAAASTGIPHSEKDPLDDWRSNVDATHRLLEGFRGSGVPMAILSSVKPYFVSDDLEQEGGLREDTPLVPDEPYAASKAAQSMLAMAYARSYDMPVVTFRCSNLYGPAPCHGPRHGWMTWFAISAAIGRALEVQGTGEQTRDMLHADDVLSACMLGIAHASRLKGRVFNIGGGRTNRISVRKAAEVLSSWGDVPIVEGPGRRHEDKHVFANYGAFLKETEWRPRVDVEEGMRSVFDWAKANSEALRSIYEGV